LRWSSFDLDLVLGIIDGKSFSNQANHSKSDNIPTTGSFKWEEQGFSLRSRKIALEAELQPRGGGRTTRITIELDKRTTNIDGTLTFCEHWIYEKIVH